MDSHQSGGLLRRQPQGKLRPIRMSGLKRQSREAMGAQRLSQNTYFGEAPSWEGALRRQEREMQKKEQRLSDTMVMDVLHRVTRAQENRQLDKTKAELERIKSRVEATVEAYEESSRQVIGSFKSRANMKFLEDLDQLEGLLSNVLERKRYEQQVTVFIVGFQETCDQQEQLLVQLHEFFHKNSRFPSDYEETADRDDLDFDDSTEKQVQEALLSAQNVTQRLLDLSKEMMSYVSNLQSKGTNKGRKRIEKALIQAKDDVNQLTEKLLAAYKGMEEKEETLKEILKQNELKTLESQHFRTHAAATKRMLETCQQDWEVQRTLLQRQVAAAAARAQESAEDHRYATAQVETLQRLAEEPAKQLETAGASPRTAQVLTEKWNPEEPQVYESRDDAGKESALALRAECEQPIPLLGEEETLHGTSSEKSGSHAGAQLPGEVQPRLLSAASSSSWPPESADSVRVAVNGRGSDSRLGEALSPRCGSERSSGSPTSVGALGSRGEGSQSERSDPSPVAEGHLPEGSSRFADEQNWAVTHIHELEEEITSLMESKQREVNALKEELRCSKASWEKERHSLQEKVNQMAQLQKFAQKDFRRMAKRSHVLTVARSWNAETHAEGDALMRQTSFSAGSESQQSSSILTDETTAPLTQDCPFCQQKKEYMCCNTETFVSAAEPVLQEFLKVYSCTVLLRDNVVELLINRGMASVASGLQGVQQLTAGAVGDVFLEAQSMSVSIHTILNETTGVIVSLVNEATTLKERFPQHGDKMLVDDPHDPTLGGENHDSEVPAEGSLQGSVSMLEDGLKMAESLEMLSSFGSTQQVLSSTPVFGESPDENSVEKLPIANVKVIRPAPGMEQPQASEGYLKERLHFLEQELASKQLEFDEERESNMKLVTELRKQIHALQRSALRDNAGSPEDPTSARVLQSIVFFTRTDMEHNVRKLQRGFYNEKVQRGLFKDAMSTMEKIVTVQRKRLVMMVERYIQHVNMKRIRDNVSMNYSNSRPVCDLLERMETIQIKRHRHWSKQMAELSALRVRVVEQLTHTLHDIEEESGLFLIKPYLSWVSSVKPINSKCKKVPRQTLVERRSNASNAFTPPPSPAQFSAVSLQKHSESSLRVQGCWLSQSLHSASLKLSNAGQTDHGSSFPSGLCTSSSTAILRHHKRSLQKPPYHQHHVSSTHSPDGVKIPNGCQNDEGRSHRIFINSGQTTACQTTQLLFDTEKSSQGVLPSLLADLEPSKDATLCGWTA